MKKDLKLDAVVFEDSTCYYLDDSHDANVILCKLFVDDYARVTNSRLCSPIRVRVRSKNPHKRNWIRVNVLDGYCKIPKIPNTFPMITGYQRRLLKGHKTIWIHIENFYKKV